MLIETINLVLIHMAAWEGNGVIKSTVLCGLKRLYSGAKPEKHATRLCWQNLTWVLSLRIEKSCSPTGQGCCQEAVELFLSLIVSSPLSTLWSAWREVLKTKEVKKGCDFIHSLYLLEALKSYCLTFVLRRCLFIRSSSPAI